MFQKLKKLLEQSKGTSPEDLMYEFRAGDLEDEPELRKMIEGYKVVDQHGGEGEGDDYYTVYHFPAIDMYVQFQGWYRSHHGAEYSEMFQVEPKEVTVTQYHRVS